MLGSGFKTADNLSAGDNVEAKISMSTKRRLKRHGGAPPEHAL